RDFAGAGRGRRMPDRRHRDRARHALKFTLLGILSAMIVDSHQHFVRLARHPQVEGFREAQLAGKDSGGLPELSDADIAKNLHTVLGLMRQRNIDMAFASPRAKAMATHEGTADQNRLWADL